MGQPASTFANANGNRVTPIPPYYLPLCDNVKAGDPSAAVSATSEDVKDAMSKILEFGAALRFLPKGQEIASGSTGAGQPTATSEQQLLEILSAVDSPGELFQYISSLAALPADGGAKNANSDAAVGGDFDARVAAYVKNLQSLYQTTKKEKARYEQRQQATRMQSTTQRKATPPPLPLPTQNCMMMGWEIVVHLLKATRHENPAQYLQALQMLKDHLLALKPTTYSDSMYLAPSASNSFNALSECLSRLAQHVEGADPSAETKVGAATIETLAEIALARGSLSTLLAVVLWLIDQPHSTVVNLGTSLSKLAALKEQQLYGKCEASGELYCCGQNSYGELGIGDDIERHLLTSVSLSGWEDIRQVVSGNEVLAILTNSGVVLTCGLNKSGQCGHGHFDERVMLLRPVPSLRSQKIRFIAASNGCEHMIALTESGLAYSWGYNDRGQLGHENLTTKIHVPKLIESLKDKKVTFAAVSYHHSAVITESGELYTFGMNDCGQLGLDHAQHMTTPQLVKAMGGHEVSMVSCGLYHTIICTAAGELFTCGKNDYGQLGLSHSRQMKVPSLVPMPNEMVCFVACGYYHTSVVTTTGHTYSFGRNEYGQLGIGSKIHQNVPNMVALSATTRMTRATCGCYHTVLLSEQGQVFVFGRNNKGQLGNRSSADSLLPVPLKVRPEKNSRRCIDVAAGFYTTSLIFERKKENDEGEVAAVDQNCLISLCGRVDIDRSGEIEGLSNFGSVSTIGVALAEGKWFYEVEVVSSGLIQIGWIDNYFQGSSDQGEGVGDHTHSWSYDGNRQRRWNSGSSSYGDKWKAGDVIGCLLDLEASEMSFYRNGINLGVAFSDIKSNPDDYRSGFMPGISLERGEIIRVNLGHQPFAYPPTNVGEFDAICKAICSPTAAASLKKISDESVDCSAYVLEGSASVSIGDRVFIIGGTLTTASATDQASNQVWVYHRSTKRWERWSDVPIGIRYHQAVALNDDTILVLGGESSIPTSRHMDLYKCLTVKGTDGSLPLWELVQSGVGAASAPPVPRAHHVAATIRVRLDTIVFMYGGKSTENEALGDVWYLSADDFTWSRLPSSMSLDPGPRSGCSSAVVGENVYLFGGQDKEEKFRADLWRYNTFDRVWHLCHDDTMLNMVEATSVHDSSDQTPRSDFNFTLPDPRINYSISADFGTVWLFGGVSQSGKMLRDLWCYSVTSQKWSCVDLTCGDDLEGCASATLVVPPGLASALPSANTELAPRVEQQSERMLLIGGIIQSGGVSGPHEYVREFGCVDSSRSFAADSAKTIATSGKSSVVLGTLRAKCSASSARTTQQCVPLTMDTAVCLLAHLDRLGGSDIPTDEMDTIQLSRCSYRSLCVDPQEQTFSSLHKLLARLTALLRQSFEGEPASSAPGILPNIVLDVLYPTLVTIRLLKLNFFELARSGIDLAEVGLSPSSHHAGGTLSSLRELLFDIAQFNPTVEPTGEAAWFYRAVKQETAATINNGFSVLFPSLLDRVEVMNQLMQSPVAADPTTQLLVPMLVPSFTSPKMLFQLMGEVPTGSVAVDLAHKQAETLATFAATLLETLWVKTKMILDAEDLLVDINQTVKKLDELETTSESRCLNVLIRAGVYWCSHSIDHGWVMMGSISTKLVTFFGQLLGRAANMLPQHLGLLPRGLQATFVGKLLPFVLVSLGSLQTVRADFSTVFKTLWQHLEAVLIRVHGVLSAIEATQCPGSPLKPITVNQAQSATRASPSLSVGDVKAHLRVSPELSATLSLPVSTVYGDLAHALWKKVVTSDCLRVKKLNAARDADQVGDFYRIALPTDLMKLFGTRSLTVCTVTGAELSSDASKLKTVDCTAISFVRSTMILSQHIEVQRDQAEELPQVDGSRVTMPPPAPATNSKILTNSTKPAVSDDFGFAWLKDLQSIMIWLGSHYAAALVIGSPSVLTAHDMDARWKQSRLLRGGLELDPSSGDVAATKLSEVESATRNHALLEQIVSGTGAGRKLVEKVKMALDPSLKGVSSGNPKLLAARLKRQDSVEAALEKSGSIESVDKAVRVTFAALLKHSHSAYLNGGFNTDGSPSEAVIDAWRSALQLRRWIVREQQKLASEHGAIGPADDAMKERQRELYNTVCEPLIRRGKLLLRLAAVPVSDRQREETEPAPKLLPGVSTTAAYELPKPAENTKTNAIAVKQATALTASKTVEELEQEDETTQADIFAFLQNSRWTKPAAADGEPRGAFKDFEDAVISVLTSHQVRGQQRLDGLRIFDKLLACTQTNPPCRLNIVSAFSTAFKRLIQRGSGTDGSLSIEKVHYLSDLDFIGSTLANRVRLELFTILSSLVRIAKTHIATVRVETEKPSGPLIALTSSGIKNCVQEVIQILEACSIPFEGNDWDEVSRINFVPMITELSSWSSWKATVNLDVPDDVRSDGSGWERFPIISAGTGHRYPKIICARSITIGTDLHQLTLTSQQGGLAVFHHPFRRGRWYWEVSIVTQDDESVFVGVATGSADLNNPCPDGSGVLVFKDGTIRGCGSEAIVHQAKVGDTLGMLLNCDEKTLECFVDAKRVLSVNLESYSNSLQGLCPAIGLRRAEVFWNLLAQVPEKLWGATGEFRFSTPIVSGCLVASPMDGTNMSLDAKSKGCHLRLTSDGSTVIAGDVNSSEAAIETIVATQTFDSELLFIEVRVLSAGRDGSCHLGFGVVGADFSGMTSISRHQPVEVSSVWPDDISKWASFGVLFDFGKGKVTAYPSNGGEPITRQVDISQLQRPLLPAMSALCNGAIVRVDFHPRHRPELPMHAARPASVSENVSVSSTNDIQVGKALQMRIHSSDGGEFSSSHGPRNCLLDDASVYSSSKGRNVNLVLRHEVDTPFCLSYVSIRGPGPGYSSPLRHAVLFVTSCAPDMHQLENYDDITPEEFASLPFPSASLSSDRDEYLPVAYFVLDGSCAQVAKQLAVSVQGRYVVIKLLCPSAGANIDLGYIGLCGTYDMENGPAYAENAVTAAMCEECKLSPLQGVFYTPKDDDLTKLCASCYDDNRGDLDVSFFAHVGLDADVSQADGGLALCVPRKSGFGRLMQQHNALKRPKLQSGTASGASSDPALGMALVSGTSRTAKPERLLAWYDDCELFSCGQNNYGELCLGHCNSTSKLEHVPFFSTKSIREIAGGNEVLAVLMKDGTLFTCGLNKSGQCGNGTFEERVLVATPVRALSGIAIDMIAAANGCEHMLAVTSDGAVYSWGYNDRGQLGLGSTISKSHTPRLIESLRDKYVITSAAVSYHHSAVITSAGELLTFGMNDCGQLGLDHTQHQHTPQLVDALSSQVVVKVACGLYHTVIVTASGELHACGKNDYGQLGLGHARSVKVPTLVRVAIGEIDEKVVDISCGYYHTVAITDKGKLVTWGRNDYGQLGIGSKDHKSSSQYVPLPLSSRIKRSSCGCYHTLILLANGRVMVFGRNNKGQLGAGARTLPSADLPLPIPLNSLSQDEVGGIAAGFYSSYIFTGHSSQSRDGDRNKDEQAQAKELAEHSTSEALYESLMKEIDRNQQTDAIVKASPFPIKRGTNVLKKLPLLKLHAASWAMMRALLYQSLKHGDSKAHHDKLKSSLGGAAQADASVLRQMIDFLLANLREMQDELDKDTSRALHKAGSRLNACVVLKNACVGLLTLCATQSQLNGSGRVDTRRQLNVPLPSLYPHFFRNQVLWVLLSCGSVDATLCTVFASNHFVLTEILRGIMSSDLAFATISIRLAMLVFPLHSVSSINTAYRNLPGVSSRSPTSSTDILTMLALLVGSPLIVRPRLCSHELGIERACTSLCESTRCLKGMLSVDDRSVINVQEDTLEQAHIASAKSAEVVSLLRYLMLYPTWKVAVNASISKAFAKIDILSDILDTVCAYYSTLENEDSDAEHATVEPVETEQLNETAAEHHGTVRKPESTTASPEVDDPSPAESGTNDSDKEDDGGSSTSASEETIRDKKALQVWQKAKESLDALASIMAAVSIIGGHVENPREGALVVIEDPDHKSKGKSGVLSSIKKDTRGELVATVLLVSAESSSVWMPAQQGSSNVAVVPVRNMRVVERVPSLLQMYDGLDSLISSLSVLVLPSTDDSSTFAELELPHNNPVQVILGRRMRMYTKQIQWRSTMALGTLLKQMPRLSNALIDVDTQLLSNVAQAIAAEDALKNVNLLASVTGDAAALPPQAMHLLHGRWSGVKQRQLLLETAKVVDDAMDRVEAATRDQVVRTLGQQNALSWGLDAIQSPRKRATPSFFNTGKSMGGNSPLRSDRHRPETARSVPGSALPHGAWGVLYPLPQLNENDGAGAPPQSQAIDYTPFHLTTPIIRVGRAADSCDLIVNDRSVSGRHFHLRRLRRDTESGSEESYELQDFSKNGTIVNGVRVHGTSVRVTPGSRISLILSRGGLITYEFQVRQGHHHAVMGHGSGAMNRMAPPPIITSGQPGQIVDGMVNIQGQEYQQPLSANGPAPMEPRSPAELQNRGSRQQSMNGRMDSLRSRLPNAGQGLRLITSIAESEVPRALISPNPAVESPRVGGFSSPRSSVLQAPGTPAVSSPIVSLFGSLAPSVVLSPASYQQRESSAGPAEVAAVRAPEPVAVGAPADGLRIALGRDSLARGVGGQRLSWQATSPPDVSRMKTFNELGEVSITSTSSPTMDLLMRLHDVGVMSATIEQCEEALHAMGGDAHTAFAVLHERLKGESVSNDEDLSSPTVQRLSTLLGADAAVCAEVLRRTHFNIAGAMRLLLSSARAELEKMLGKHVKVGRPTTHFESRRTGDAGDVDAYSSANPDAFNNLQEIMDENPTYALLEASAKPDQTRPVPGSPSKKKVTVPSAAAKSQLALWVECAYSGDERILQLTSSEVDEEENALCGLLTAVYSRKLVDQIVRLFTDVADQADNMLAAFGDPVTLRQLIVFPAGAMATSSKSSPPQLGASADRDSTYCEGSTMQRILTRTATEFFSSSPTNTLQSNMAAVQNLSSLCMSIDRSDSFSGCTDPTRSALACLLRTLLAYEDSALQFDDSGLLHQTNIMHNLVMDTLLHTLSRTFVHHGSLLNWKAAMSKTRRPEATFPKGPIRLSCGIECMIVTSYDRVWSVPAPDPLLQFRHKWRKRDSAPNPRDREQWGKSLPDGFVTIWRPVLPSGVKVANPSNWFALSDVVQCGGDSPERPVMVIHDDGSGLLLPPVGFERVDVSGKGLPRNSNNDPDFQRKQVRSVWWPTAPPGYVAFGCVAGNKEEPFHPPALSSIRCIREDLVQRAESYSCVWRAETRSFGPPTLLKALDNAGTESGRRNQQSESMSVLELAADQVCVRTSLWSIDAEFCSSILPVISIDGVPTDSASAFTINLSPEDKILCSAVTVNNAMSFVNALLACLSAITSNSDAKKPHAFSAIRPELGSALFALVKQVLTEKLPGSGQTAVALVRALIRLIQSGIEWKDKSGLLYCRSKIITLQQDQEGGLMHHSLLQAFVELMLVVDDQNRAARVEELKAYLDRDTKSTMHLPYRFQFARADAHKEMLVSHSSKMVVTRHFSGEERKFLMEFHNDETANPTDATPPEGPVLECYSCRFEHTPELIMMLKDELKAEIIYFELAVLEWSNSTVADTTGLFSFGLSSPEFPLEGPPVGMNVSGASTYAFAPVNGKVHTGVLTVDHWRWNEQVAAVAIGDVYGCGLRVDTREIFFTKNGRSLGSAFSSIDNVHQLHPTVSVSADCKFLINFGSSGSVGDMFASKVNFAYRFNTMDCDNIMNGFEWYEQLGQVYGVMKALMDPARDHDTDASGGLLPDEFMLSADNFLSEISQDVCIKVESAHPYDLELHEALVSIPLATSIRVKLDSQCETANSHCLQILQGGDGAESSSGSSESEVRAFTGTCGGQEVTIDGDSFVWRFPVQSNFQCRVDRVRKGPYLKLENRDTRLSLARDKGWQTAIGVARFDSGIHIWEVRIAFVTASSNIFLGIARRDVRLDSYLGKDNRGWGWIGNRALWHNGSKQRGTYGEKFKTGDIVRMTLDLKRGTLSYALNGKDLGVAFGPGGVGPKLEGTFYPGFALYNQRDSIDLIGGHRVEDGDAMLQGAGVSGLLPGAVGEEGYYSEDDDEGMGDVDDGIPNFRMELATALSQMGFPMDWCVYALRHCEDDAEQAADFVLANMHVMEALVREEAEAQSRRIRHREALAAAAASPAGVAISSAVAEASAHSETGAGAESDDTEDQASEAIEGTTSGVGDTSNSDGSAAQSTDKWGISFTAVPEFSVTGRRLLASKYATKLQQLHLSQATFTRDHDNAIVQIVNEICESRAEALMSCDPLRMTPEDFVPTEEHLRRFPFLDGIPLPQLQKRFLILRNFNCRLQNSLSFVDLSVPDEQSLLAKGARGLRGIIFQHVKLAWWLNILKEQQSPAAARPEIEIDRHRAREATETTGIKDSVFAQSFDQLHAIQPSLLRGADRAFKCQFVGEFGDDFGGLYRECIAQISSELQSNVLPLLTPCPNAVAAVGDNRDKFVPNVHARSDARLVHMAEFLGKLIGIAIRTKTPLDLNLPAVFWKTLVGQPVIRRDVEAVHHGCFQVVDAIDNINAHGITETMFDEIIDAHFTVVSSSRKPVDVIPGGKHVRVLWEDKDDYARAVQTYRLTEFTPLCQDITRGIATILPAPTIALFTWCELATLVCGKPTVDIELLRRRTIYGDGCQASDPHIAYFWDVLGEFTDEQKSSFLRFVWGRSRLPTHAADFTQDFKISGLPKAAGRPDTYLPIAHTCFFSIDLPNYSCHEVMKERLLYAITHCLSIDADNTTVAQRAGQGLNWTATTTATATATASAMAAAAATTTSTVVATAAAAVSSVIAGLSVALGE